MKTRLFYLIMLVPLMTSGRASACTCHFTFLHERYQHADIVATGLITSERIEGASGTFNGYQVLEVKVGEVFKGSPGETFTIEETPDTMGCGYDYIPGEEYLIFASWIEANKSYSAGYCSGSDLKKATAIEDLRQVITALDTDGTYKENSPYMTRFYKVPLRDGKTEGLVMEYDKEGRLVSENFYQNGVKVREVRGRVTGPELIKETK